MRTTYKAAAEKAGVPAKLLTEDAAAQYLAMSVYALRQWRRQDRGPAHVTLGRAIRYNRADLDAYVVESTTRHGK